MEDSKAVAQPSRPARIATGLLVNAAMLGISLLTLLDLVFGWPWLLWGMGISAATFIFLRRSRVPPHIGRTSLALVLVTMALLNVIPAPAATLGRGLRIGCLIGSLLVTVTLLSRAALRLPRVSSVMNGLFRLPSGQRYGGLTVASQFFGGLLGLAGLTMMMEIAAQQPDASEAEKISAFTAVARGYAALSLWSPMYSNLSIVLALYPGSDWLVMLPYAVMVSAALMLLGMAMDRMRSRGDRGPRSLPTQSAKTLLRSALPVIASMLCFLLLVVAASRLLRIPVTAVIVAGAPVAAWLVNVRASGGMAAATRALVQDFKGFQSMAGEVMLFLASGCAGTVMAAAIPSSWTQAIAHSLHGSLFMGSLLLTMGTVLLSATSIHPMLSAVLVASSFSPQLLGLPLTAHLCSVLVGWGLAIIVTPFSVLSLMASRFSRIPILVISLRANLLFVVTSVLLSATVLGGLSTLARH